MSTQEEKLYHVVQTLEEHQTRIAELYTMQHAFEKQVLVQVAELKMKAGVWGLIAGALPVTAAALLYVLKGSL